MTPAIKPWFDALPGPIRAAFWMTTSAMFYTVSVTIVRHLSQTLPTFEIVFFRNFLALPFMLPWLISVGLGALHTRRLGLHAVRGLFSATNLWCTFGAVAFLPVADLTAIAFLQPIIAVIAAAVFLREVIGLHRGIAIAVGFAGALIVIRPGIDAVNIGVGLALAGTMAAAIVPLFVKVLARTDPPDTIAAYLFLIHTVLALVPAIVVWRTPSLGEFAWLAALGFFAMLIHRCFNRAIVAADMSVSLPFNFTRLIWAALLGWLAFGELPDVWTWVGGTVIFGATVALGRIATRR